MKVEILQNGNVIETKEFGDGTYKIGRASECDIRLKSTQVSKQHALLVIKAGKAAIVDVGSSNGIFVNGVLVRKQRIEPRDSVILGGFQIRVGFHSRPQAAQPSTPVSQGNLAMQMEPDGAPVAGMPPVEKISPQEKMVLLMEQKVLVPFFDLLKVYDWRWVLAVILMVTLAMSVLLSVVPLMQWGREITTKEALQRAHAVLTQVVRENYRVLSKTSDYSRLTVEAAEKAEGILVTYIIDSRSGNILAPAKYFNSSIQNESGAADIYAQLAVKMVLEGKEEHTSIDAGNGYYVIAQAIPHYETEGTTPTEDKGLPQPNAIALSYFKIPESINATFEPMSVAVLISVFLSLLAFLAISKMVAYPVSQLNEQLDAALKGEDVQITCDWKLPELQTLATVINFSVTRMRKAGGGLAGPVSGANEEVEDEGYIRAVTLFDFGTSDGLLVLDKDKKIRFVGKAIEEMIGLRPQYAMGQNISDACRDQGFAGTSIDLAERVLSSLGENQTATLDINGTARNMVAVPHKNSGGEIRFILLTVKLGA